MENSRIKEELNTIHAPEALLQSTMAKMHEENEKLLHAPAQPDGEEYPELGKYYGKKKKSWFNMKSFSVLLVTAMAALAFTFFNRDSSKLLWHQMEVSEEPYFKAFESSEHTVTPEEFEAQTNIPLLPYMTVNGYTTYLCYESEGTYSARLEYSTDSNCTLILSAKGSGITADLDPSKYTEIEGKQVYLAKEKSSGMFACMWEDDLGEYCLSTYGSEEAILKLLGELFALQKDLK